MKYFKKLVGENVYLSPMNPDDYEIYTKWLNDANITKYLSIHNHMVSLFGEKEYIEKMSKEDAHFSIIKCENDELMGSIAFDIVDYKNGCATLGIFIGNEENLSKGYGSEAIKLLLDFGFNELRLHNVMLTVHADNPRAIKCYEKCGFKEIGRRHECLYRDGKYVDLIYMEIINKKTS